MHAKIEETASDLKRSEAEMDAVMAERATLSEEVLMLGEERVRLVSAIDGLCVEESGMLKRRDQALAAAVDAEQQVISTCSHIQMHDK